MNKKTNNKKSSNLSGKLHIKLDAKRRKNSSARWLSRHINDEYVNLSKKLGYRSRAAFKLLELEEKFNILNPNKPLNVLDLGAAPGSWSQVIVEKNPNAKILAIDLLDMEAIHNAYVLKKDIFDEDIIQNIKSIINDKFNIILSDISPNTTGHSSTDHLRIMNIAHQIFEIALDTLDANGCLIIKIFNGVSSDDYINNLKNYFKKVSRFKPKSSRKESSEFYLIAKDFKL